MQKDFRDILALARENIKINPYARDKDTVTVCQKYLRGLADEVLEVEAEIKNDNSVYLTDELSDIAWDYAVLLALAEDRGLIESVELVLEHGHTKFTERSAAFTENNNDKWDMIKKQQKDRLKERHQQKYGN